MNVTHRYQGGQQTAMTPKPFRPSLPVNLRTLLVAAACISSLLILPSEGGAEKNITTDIDTNSVRRARGIPIKTGFERRFEADIDGGGDLEEWRVPFGVNLGTKLGKQWRLGSGVNYVYNKYNFSGSTGFAGLDPWEDIHFIRISVPVMYRASRRLQIMVTPVLQANADTLSKGWQVNMGASIHTRRFRLDDDGSAPDGVGQHSGIPAWGSIAYAPSAAFKNPPRYRHDWGL